MLIEKLSPVMTEKIGRRLWVLLEDFHFTIEGVERTIPKGFVFDGNSTPRPMWFLCSPAGGAYSEAGLIHDWFYSLDCSEVVTREFADLVHKYTGKFRGSNKPRAFLVHKGIRVGGKKSFRVVYSSSKLLPPGVCYDYEYAVKRVKGLVGPDNEFDSQDILDRGHGEVV